MLYVNYVQLLQVKRASSVEEFIKVISSAKQCSWKSQALVRVAVSTTGVVVSDKDGQVSYITW